MTTLIDTNLKLIYKNMIGLNNINVNTSGDSYFITNVSINSNLYVSSNTILNNALINSNLNLYNQTIFNNNVSLNSFLNISGPFTINGKTTLISSLNILGSNNINGNLIVSGTTIFNGSITNNSILNVSGNTIFQNGINVNYITGTSITFNSSIINIGNPTSMVFINGTANSLASSEILINNKLISLNVNFTNYQGIDNGNLSGIQIMGLNSNGFIMTNFDATRYQIKAPIIGSPTNYVTIQDLNNNLVISGKSIFLNNISNISNLNVSGNSIFNNSVSLNNSLYISGLTIINNICSFNNNLNLNGTIIINSTSMLSSLNVSGLTNLNDININNFLNVSGNTILNNQTTCNSNLNISGLTIFNNKLSINSKLNISSLTIFNGLTSFNSNLNISSYSIIVGNKTLNSNLFISNISIFNNSITLNSSLEISGSSIFNNFVSINSNLGIFGQLIANLNNYNSNVEAKNGGIPIWGWYRTGGVIKIRLNDNPPIVYLSGSTTLTIYTGFSFTDPGAYALDYYNNTNLVYISSIVSGSTNLLSSNILISGISTLITQISSLSAGNYTATYQATDSIGNIGYNYRILNINLFNNSTINNWILRVQNANGILSQNEINAHIKFIISLQSNSNALSKILRLNTFCGDSLNAALCPIIIDGGLSNNGASLNDTLQSGTPNYSRTGGLSVTGGAVNTGLKFSSWSNNGQNLHFGLYAFTEIGGRCMGVWRETVYTRHYLLCDYNTNSGGWSNPVNFNANSSSLGMNIMQCRTNDVPNYYRCGVKTTVTGSLDNATPSDWPCTIFAANGSSNGTNSTNAIYGQLYGATTTRSGGYTIGYGLSDEQAIDITNAFNQLNIDLSRS
jgi:hypothetical protein